MLSSSATYYAAFCTICISVLKQFNAIVTEPYMVQSTQYTSCFKTDTSIKGRAFPCPTGASVLRRQIRDMGPENNYPPWAVSTAVPDICRESLDRRVSARYILSLFLKRIFMFKCTLPMLRLTATLSLLGLPIILTRLVCYHQRQRPPTSFLGPIPESIVLSLFPLAWFFGFLYYTEVPSLVFVVWTVVAASQGSHWLAGLVREFPLYHRGCGNTDG